MAKKGSKSKSLGTVALWLVGDNKGLALTLERTEKDLKKWANDASQTIQSIGEGFSSVGETMTEIGAAGVAAFASLGYAAFGAMKAFAEGEKADKRLETVLKSTGNAAGMTKEELVKLADALMDVTAFDDDVIKSGEALMLMFTNIGRETFPKAMEAALDLSVALGMDVPAAAKLLGKALDSPADGLGKLAKAGIIFSDAQKKVIEDLVKGGETARAQGIILSEVAKKVGGQARAELDTATGKMKQLLNFLDDAWKLLGKGIYDAAIKPFEKDLKDAIKNFGSWMETTGVPFVQKVIFDIKKILKDISADPKVMQSLKDTFDTIKSAFQWIIEHPDIAAKIAVYSAAFTALNLVLGPVFMTIGSIVKSVGAFVGWLPKLFKMLPDFAKVFLISTKNFITFGLRVAWIGTLFYGLCQAVRAFAQMLGSGDWTTNNFYESFKKQFPELTKAMSDFFYDFNVKLEENRKAGKTWSEANFFSTLADTIPGAEKAIDGFFDWFVAWLDKLWVKVKEKATAYWENEFKPGWKAVFSEIGDYFDQEIKEWEEGLNRLILLLAGIPGWIALANGAHVIGGDDSSGSGTGGAGFRAAMPSYSTVSSVKSSAINFNAPLIASATIRENADVGRLAKEIAYIITKQRLGRGRI